MTPSVLVREWVRHSFINTPLNLLHFNNHLVIKDLTTTSQLTFSSFKKPYHVLWLWASATGVHVYICCPLTKYFGAECCGPAWQHLFILYILVPIQSFWVGGSEHGKSCLENRCAPQIFNGICVWASVYFWWHLSLIDLDSSLGSLSCWKVKSPFIFSFLAEAEVFVPIVTGIWNSLLFAQKHQSCLLIDAERH